MSKKVVTIGGGAGQSRVLAGLKRVKELKDLEVTAIVTAADSGLEKLAELLGRLL